MKRASKLGCLAAVLALVGSVLTFAFVPAVQVASYVALLSIAPIPLRSWTVERFNRVLPAGSQPYVIRDAYIRDVAVPVLAVALRDPEAQIRYDALRLLDRMAPRGPALAALVACLEDENSLVRLEALTVLRKMPKELRVRAVPQLVRMLESGAPESIESACYALEDLGPRARAAAPALRPLLASESADVQAAARAALSAVEQGDEPR